jgi:hypothetical protein
LHNSGIGARSLNLRKTSRKRVKGRKELTWPPLVSC